MDPEKQREIARKGGRAAHAKGTAHEFTPDEARAAGRKGGEVVSRNREHMATIGRRGGERRGAKRAANRDEKQQPQTAAPSPSQPARPTTDTASTQRPYGSRPIERGDREVEIFRDREQHR